MGGDSQEIETKPVWKDYYELLHDEIGLFQLQVRAALEARRLKKAEKLEINGKPASFEEIREVAEMLDGQAPRHDVRLWKQSSYVIKSDIVDAEKFIKKAQKVLKGIKTPKRPLDVDEWMEKTG